MLSVCVGLLFHVLSACLEPPRTTYTYVGEEKVTGTVSKSKPVSFSGYRASPSPEPAPPQLQKAYCPEPADWTRLEDRRQKIHCKTSRKWASRKSTGRKDVCKNTPKPSVSKGLVGTRKRQLWSCQQTPERKQHPQVTGDANRELS